MVLPQAFLSSSIESVYRVPTCMHEAAGNAIHLAAFPENGAAELAALEVSEFVSDPEAFCVRNVADRSVLLPQPLEDSIFPFA